MLKVNASAFYAAVSLMRRAHGRLISGKDTEYKPEEVISKSTRNSTVENMAKIETAVSELGARVTAIAARNMVDDCQAADFTYRKLEIAMRDVDSRLRDELSLISLFLLDAEFAKYFGSLDPQWGEVVADRLPIAIPDIEDAGKCIALSQGTASVFHSMRVMEAALKGLATLLGIPYAPSWESYIVQIEKCITEKHKRKTVKWKRDEPFYREILGNLQTIKIAWRNPTMHIVRRYSVEESEEIYIAVRGLIKRLAPHLPKPKIAKQQDS
ncbi:MAG TPA: hypothetical protein VHX92_09210 [Rhizomicrobium sp.]|jgi:hypothetical protein|nr:hypothetical protein [Rhizomicrobium sp.]